MMVSGRFITKGRGAGRKVIPLGDRAKVPVKVKVKTDPKLQLLKDINKRGIITEQELGLVMRRLNDKVYTFNQVLDMIREGEQGLRLTLEQNKKGHEYLMGQWKTPRGVERKNNPFGHREEVVLDNFEQSRLVNIVHTGSMYVSHYLPVYQVYSKDGDWFQYHMAGGKVNTLG